MFPQYVWCFRVAGAFERQLDFVQVDGWYPSSGRSHSNRVASGGRERSRGVVWVRISWILALSSSHILLYICLCRMFCGQILYKVYRPIKRHLTFPQPRRSCHSRVAQSMIMECTPLGSGSLHICHIFIYPMIPASCSSVHSSVSCYQNGQPAIYAGAILSDRVLIIR